MIDFGNGQHKVVIGMTGTGKTFTVRKELGDYNGGAIFWNTMRVPMAGGWIEADGKDDMQAIMAEVEKGGRINFLPSTRIQDARRQMVAVIDGLYDRKWSDFVFAIDEAHLYDKEAHDSIIRAITTGRNQGVEMVTMSQRLQLMPKTIMTQSPYKVLFYLENETRYCEGYGIPYEEIEARILAKDKGGMVNGKFQPSHAYCTYFMGQIGGAFIA